MKRKILALTAAILLLGLLTSTVKGDWNWATINDWDLTYSDHPQYAFIDTTVTHNGHSSIRIEQETADGVREIDLENPVPVNVGDHVYFSMYIKTEASTTGSDGNHWMGARIGADMYAASGLVGIDTLPRTDQQVYDNWVPYGTSEWILRVWDFIVPSTYYTENLNNEQLSPAQQIRYVWPWLQVIPYADEGAAWFADPEIYINPSTIQNITIYPSASAAYANASYQSYTSWGGSTTIAVIGVVGGLMLFIFRWGTHIKE